MGLLEKLKSALGLDGARSSEATASGDVDVTVEREPSTEDEDAVKGTSTAGPADDSATEPSGDDTDAEPDTDAESDIEAADEDAAETDDTEESAATDDTEAEPAETDDTEDAEAEAAADDSEDAADESDAPPAEGGSDPVTELSGIGPAYAKRLHGLDIETVGELAVADAADIAEQTDLGEKRVTDWIEQAKSY